LPHPHATDLDTLARQLAATAGLDVHGVQVLTHRIPMTVQVLVQRSDGTDVTLDECARFSGPLGEAIEAAGLLDPHDWVLEVSSPGIGEVLRHDRDFSSFRGFPVEVLCERAEGGHDRREGLLLSRDAETVQLNVRGRTLRLPRDRVVQVRLISSSGDG
jgi:ribosome maturation factor RimP